MIEQKDYFIAGYIKKTHGISGEVILTLTDNTASIDELESAFLMIDGGLVPFFIQSCFQRDTNSFIVDFEWVDSEPEAKKIIGKEFWIPRSMKNNASPAEINVIGYKVRDINHGYLGTVQEIFENPQQKVIQILNDSEELLVPFIDSIVKEIIEEENEIVIESPEGLIELYRQ